MIKHLIVFLISRLSALMVEIRAFRESFYQELFSKYGIEGPSVGLVPQFQVAPGFNFDF